MRGAADAALDAGMDELAVLQFDTSSEAGRYLADELQPGDVILVKGSQSMRAERAVLELMEHREQADTLLVRHDGTWKRKV
jgi:UDP-N-acetylmuramyl pentapeptide synthase